MYTFITILYLIAISFGEEDKYLIRFSETTGRLYTRDAVIVIASTKTETSDYDPNERKSYRSFGAPCVTWDGIKGVCTRYHKCFPNENQNVVDIKNTCYEDKTKTYGICCTKEIKHIGRNLNTSKQGWFSDVVQSNGYSQNAENGHKNELWVNLQELPVATGRKAAQCGVPKDKVWCDPDNNICIHHGRIAGGIPSKEFKWPWAVLLLHEGYPYCGASLITDKHGLTAAHCTRPLTSSDLAKMRADIGEYDLDIRGSRILVQIKRAASHIDYTDNLHNDISLLTLRNKVTFSPRIQPICLPRRKSYANVMATVVGWGALEEDGESPSVQHEVSIPIWSNARCKRKYRKRGLITDSFMCAGDNGKDSCFGDSGGPLMVKEGESYVLVGIVSWGSGCGSTSYPGVYTRVSSYLSWIKANLLE